MRIIEELLERTVDSLRWPRNTLYPLKLALTSPTSGGRSVGIVRWQTKPRSFFYNDAVSSSDYRVSNSKISSWWTGKDITENGHGLIWNTIWTSAWRNWVKPLKLYQDSRSPDRDFNPGLSEYEKGFQITLPWHTVRSGVEVNEHTEQWPVYIDGEKLSGAKTRNCCTFPCNIFHFAHIWAKLHSSRWNSLTNGCVSRGMDTNPTVPLNPLRPQVPIGSIMKESFNRISLHYRTS
jgi:hypothetical protein